MPNFVESSLFLHEHAAIQQFAQQYVRHFNLSDSAQWSIVCERKEDVTAIRDQVFSAIQALQAESDVQICSGISVYTLDQLAQNFCYCIASIEIESVQKMVPNFLRQPYIDIATQENIIHLILNLFGYTASDSRAIARQILILIDLQLPPDTNIFELILNSHAGENASEILNTHSLKQILAAFQYSQIELNGYARFQSLITQYMQGLLFDDLNQPQAKKHFILPHAFLKGPILWVQAPQYQGSYSKAIKPGHFQRSLVDEFKAQIVKLRKHLFNATDETFFDSQTIILQAKEMLEAEHIQFYFSQDDFLFYEKAKEIFSNENFVLLGDIDKNEFQYVRPNGGGSYPLSMKDIEHWRQNRFCALELNQADEHAYTQNMFQHLDSAYDADINLFSFLKKTEAFNDIASVYDLKKISLTESYFFNLFINRVQKETVIFEPDASFQKAYKALSFFSGSSSPKKIIVLGSPHSSVNTGFNVKILNNTMLFIKKMGIEIELPTSEFIYHEFWNHLLNQKIETHFYLEKKSDLENLNDYIRALKNNIYPLNQPLSALPKNELKNDIFRPPHKENLSVTEFEQYMQCPFKFFFQQVLKIDRNKEASLLPDPMQTGSQMHLLCEQLMGRLVGIFGNQMYLTQMPALYENIILRFKNEDLFASLKQSDWEKAIFEAIDSSVVLEKSLLKNAFQEAIAHIWKRPPHLAVEGTLEESMPPRKNFVHAQQTELLKRTFLQFLFIEQKNCASPEKKRVAVLREQPISFELGGLRLNGRLDRVDLLENGFEIIDYKTAKVTKSKREVFLSPKEYLLKKKGILNIQGALYGLGFLKSAALNDALFDNELSSSENGANPVVRVSLYFLKYIHDDGNSILSHTFSEPMTHQNEVLSLLEEEYSLYAEKFLRGDFNPMPLLGKEMCSYCDARFFCSFYNREKA